MIIFTALKFKNFLSTGNSFTEICLNSNKMTLITGINGAGKSQFLDALTFVLFGKPFRKITKPSLINSVNKKDCLVEIEFSNNSHDYKIIRGIKPNKFEIYIDDKLLDQSAAIKDYQEYLEKNILNSTFKSFTQIVILGSATFTPFMKISPMDRRIVIDDLLGTQIFSIMSVLNKQEILKNKDEISNINSTMTTITSKIEILKKQINALEINDNTTKTNLQEEISKLEFIGTNHSTELSEYEMDLVDIKNQLSGETIKKSLRNQLQPMQVQIKSKIDHLLSHIEFYHDNINCPTCKQEIDVEYKNNIVIKSIEEKQQLQSGYSDITTRLGELNNDLSIYGDIRNEFNKIHTNIKVKKSKIIDINTNIKKLKTVLESIDEDNKKSLLLENINDLKSLDKELILQTNEKDLLLNKREDLNIVLQILKDDGIKTKIIDRYLPVINQTINQYLSSMDFMVNFDLDSEFNETIKSQFRDTFSYENFSEGEKSRIDLSLLLTWRKIAKLRNSVHTNLLIMDEILDGSLDNNGSEELIDIIKNVLDDSNIFIISHRDNLKENFDNVLSVSKVGNYSVITENNND